MPYRRTDRVRDKLAARRADLLSAAASIAVEQGLAAVQIAEVARRAGIAAGTVYRYFPSKSDLVNAVLQAVGEAELATLHHAAAAAPGPLSALAAAVVTFARRALAQPTLIAAALAQPDQTAAATEASSAFRRAVTAAFAARIAAAAPGGSISEGDSEAAAIAMLGALTACTTGTGARGQAGAAERSERAFAAALFALRLLGIRDAQARGLIAQALSHGPA